MKFASTITPEYSQVWIDFDGTISQRDVLDDLILRYAKNESWRLIEERWAAGVIGSHECLRQEFALLRVSSQELEDFVRTVPIDPGFAPLVKLLHTLNVPMAILSDGIGRFINTILSQNGISGVPVLANSLVHRGEQLILKCHRSGKGCESRAAHCKCQSAERIGSRDKTTIYIGDGRSDLCPAAKADVVFAKGVLAKELAHRLIPFIAYRDLTDVVAALEGAWRQTAPTSAHPPLVAHGLKVSATAADRRSAAR